MDTTASTSDLDVERADPATHPYAPSWANVLAGWLERLPGPTWAAYAVGMLLSVLVSAGQAGFQSVQVTGGALGIVYHAILPFGVLGLIHVLDRSAGRALHARATARRRCHAA